MHFMSKPFMASFTFSYGALILVLLLWSVAITGSAIYLESYWHAHEIIYGVWGLGMFGFVATAAPNWTGGKSLPSHFTMNAIILWVANRGSFAYIIDGHQIYFSILLSLSWWLYTSCIIAKLVIVPRHARGMVILALYIFIALQDLTFLGLEASGYETEASILIKATVLFYTSLIGIVFSKIYPFFCSRALSSYRQIDMRNINLFCSVASVIGATLYMLSAFYQPIIAPGWIMIIVGIANCRRLYLWADRGISKNAMLFFPFLAMLNIAWGLILLGIANIFYAHYFTDILHFIAIAGILLMFSTIMLRVYLGHTGKKIIANRWVKCSFLLFLFAGLLRSAFSLTSYDPHYLILSIILLIAATLIIQFQFIRISTQRT